MPSPCETRETNLSPEKHLIAWQQPKKEDPSTLEHFLRKCESNENLVTLEMVQIASAFSNMSLTELCSRDFRLAHQNNWCEQKVLMNLSCNLAPR